MTLPSIGADAADWCPGAAEGGDEETQGAGGGAAGVWEGPSLHIYRM